MRVESGEVAERLTIVRLDPATVRFRVHYDPVVPRPMSGWAEHLQPLLVVNGGYFTPENETTGLLISDGQVWGTPYGNFAGLFAVTSDGQVSVRWLRDWPYDPDEPLTDALQSFPVLVKPGGVMGFPADADDGRPARRTVVAQDNQGRILMIVAPRGNLSLHELARFLAESDLELDVALNLDGGFSTGLWLKTGGATVEAVAIDSLVPVPSVISADYR
jgi:exopolysaccharide biosynthesis protein